MPEGPELFLASRFINNVCRGRVFGKIFKSDISKNPVVHPPAERYIISSSSRGKEIKVTLTENVSTSEDGKDALKRGQTSQPKSLDILFTFGLAGKFDFHEASELQKHAHMNFFTCDSGPNMVLSFVDNYMRFGKWTPGADFSKDRGPCVLFDYNNFRDKVLQHLGNAAFKKPICEVLLNQKYFNGIGNYLRAEILYRTKIPPFVSARSVLEPLAESGESKVKSETPDILQLCTLLPQEVVSLESSWYDGKDRSDNSNAFNSWLQCYYQDGMKNIADHNKRTVWYSGPLGPLAPKEIHVRGKKRSKSKKKSSDQEEETEQVSKKTTSKRRKQKEEVNEVKDEDFSASEIKRTKQTKSAKAKLSKRAIKNTEDKTGITTDTPENPRPKKKKSSKLRVENLPEDVKDRIQTGRLTRGKIKLIVDVIEEITEKKTKVIKKAKSAHTFEDKVTAAEGGKEAEKPSDGSIRMSARTKAKARTRKSVSNSATNLETKKSTQRMKLKTPLNRSNRRLSSN